MCLEEELTILTLVDCSLTSAFYIDERVRASCVLCVIRVYPYGQPGLAPSQDSLHCVTTTQAFATFKASWFNQYDVITNTQPHAMQSSSANAVVAPPLTISVETLKKGP